MEGDVAVIPVILAGGAGTRLWPLSRQTYAKPFITLESGHSLFQATVLRLAHLAGKKNGLVVCQEEQRFVAAQQLLEVGMAHWKILLEPVGRGTAPAAACAAMWLASQGSDEDILLVSPADHRIGHEDRFNQSVRRAITAASQGNLALLGVVPSHGESGYGYIERGLPLAGGEETFPAFRVGQFIEKPDLERANAMVASGRYYWNSGLFVFRGQTFLGELARLAPNIWSSCEKACRKVVHDLTFLRLEAEAYQHCPNDSIDWAVMEKTGLGVVVPLDAAWSDVGSWSSLWQEGNRDVDGNLAVGDVLLQDVSNSYVHSDSGLLAVLGCEDLVVVQTKDATLVTHRQYSQRVKELVGRLQVMGRAEASQHRRHHRPWGMFETMDCGEGFQVKRLTVRPGASLSFQYHRHRQEHWVVVRGMAEVWREEERFFLRAGESAFIPVGSRHRLANPGPNLLEIIEVQTGSYLGEDDIVRLEDQYGRCM
ncbi:MAG: mannose-1-phosphate guanylyltransferase/mannose-6-phosphate isomerase [Magnetococcales bacterium]|nr:mannose-1-phosphate guanylyltransferase/mannose-6-phosphate isomerase [Magnetococcales bacterium]NGZ26529.1 mannose-1-phosphate guanylyltransferase/mannose-6-phosphate isomerase [Magnetococcales bacterium]